MTTSTESRREPLGLFLDKPALRLYDHSVAVRRVRHSSRRGVLVVSLNDDRSAANLVGVDPRSGRERWRCDGWREHWDGIGVDPIIHNGKVFITSAEQYRQAARFTIIPSPDGQPVGTLRQDWSTNRVAGYTGCAVLLEGHLYLVDSNGILKCVAWDTGQIKWNQSGFDEHGTLIAADRKLLIQTGASGELIIAAADPTGYRELRRTAVFENDGHTFTARFFRTVGFTVAATAGKLCA